MIKTGAYGFFRFLTVVFTSPQGSGLFYLQESFRVRLHLDWYDHHAGWGVNGPSPFAHETGAAYSSISQMGYILFSLGTGVMLGQDGAVGWPVPGCT